jgi:urease accessory protein
MISARRAAAYSTAAAALIPQPLRAHTVIPGVSGFEGGLLHPLLVPAHAMSIIALALLLASRPAGERHAAFATFLAALAGAVALVVLAFQTDRAEIALLACAAAAGLLVAGRITLPLLPVIALTAIVAFALQFDSVPATISISETLLTLAGAALAAFAELALIGVVAARARLFWQILAIRILGSWIAAMALLILALKLR